MGKQPSNTFATLKLLRTFIPLICFVALFSFQASASSKDPLTIEERVAMQKSIESVYWKHRIWPKENKIPKPSLEELIPASNLNEKVLSNLRKSAALKSLWQTLITPDEVQTEIKRMVNESKDRVTLSEIFQALRNDPFLIAEGLVHPQLVEQKIRKLYGYDQRFHGALRKQAQADIDQFKYSKSWTDARGTYLETTWVRTEEWKANDSQSFYLDSEEWELFQNKLSKIFAFSSVNQLVGTNGILSSIQEDENQFYVITVLEHSEDRIRLGTVHWNKIPFDEWWHETETNIPLAANEELNDYDFDLPAFKNISCSTDSWTPTAEPPEPNVPFARYGHIAVWTGTEMIVWGGNGVDGGETFTNTGAKYDPATNTWLPTSMLNVPIGRHSAVAVWTGSEMVMWGGCCGGVLRSGGRYNPITDTWTPTTLTNAPEDRYSHTGVWTGNEMIIWGGRYAPLIHNSGGRYNPGTDTWLSTTLNNAPSARGEHTAVWTGDKMIIWGGWDGGELNTGGLYDPQFDTWMDTTLTNAPSNRQLHRAVWSGNKMIVWGGLGGTFLNNGGRYDPFNDTWSDTSMNNVPIARHSFTSIWTGKEMIVWGGFNSIGWWLNDGGRYDPLTNQWMATSLINAPEGRDRHTAVWTGSTMIVWGGQSVGATGGIYCAGTDSNPVSVDDNYSSVEDTILMITQPGVLSNDTDPNSDPLTAIIASGPLSGSVTLNPDGSFEYSPSQNFNGQDLFTYQAYDGITYSNPSTVSLTIAPVNDAPVANDESYSGQEDSQLNIPASGILSNDTDVENDTLNAVLVGGPSNGQLNLNSDGAFSYVPEVNFNGTDYFTYNTTDGQLFSNTATVSITINPVNDAPNAENDSYQTQEDTALVITAPGLLSNDTDIDSNALTTKLISAPTHGDLSLNPDGSFTYIPSANFNGIDSITYKATDGTSDSNTATVFLTVDPVNDAPVSANDFWLIQEDSALQILPPGVLSNDGDPDGDALSAFLVSNPSHGNLSFNQNGSFLYTPDQNFNGNDSFTYRANDGIINGNITTVTITLVPVNDPPFAANDIYNSVEDTVVTIGAPGVLENDFDVDSNSFTANLDSNPSNGTVTLNADGSFSYTPNANFSGVDSFTYHTNDGILDSNIATVQINVGSVNDWPVAVNDEAVVTQNSTDNLIDVLTNDIDADGDALTISAVSQGANGTVSIVNGGSELAYTPNPGFNGNDSFTYTLEDGNGGSDTGTVSVNVTLPSCLFCDDFNDDVLNPNWKYIKPAWTESIGNLNGDPNGKRAIAVATPIFGGCQSCNVETRMQTAGGSLNKVWLLAWYVDKKNTMELLMKEESDIWVLKQKVAGKVVSKAKGIRTIDPNSSYIVRITFNGISFQVFIDDLVTPLFTLIPKATVPTGSVGFQIKNTTASFDYIIVNN